MRLRESGMPEEAYWETLLDVELILDRLALDRRLGHVAELGCGYGTFTIPVARRIAGILYSFDIDAFMIARTQERALTAGMHNIHLECRDVVAEGLGLDEASMDVCLLFNIVHGEEPVRLLREAARVVKVGGSVHVIHWRYDLTTPRGPSMDIRPRPEQIIAWAEEAGLDSSKSSPVDMPPWHYGLTFLRPPSTDQQLTTLAPDNSASSPGPRVRGCGSGRGTSPRSRRNAT